MFANRSRVQSVIFQNYTKQEAERWLDKYHFKPIGEPNIYTDEDGYILKRQYILHDKALFKRFHNKKINADISFIIAYYS